MRVPHTELPFTLSVQLAGHTIAFTIDTREGFHALQRLFSRFDIEKTQKPTSCIAVRLMGAQGPSLQITAHGHPFDVTRILENTWKLRFLPCDHSTRNLYSDTVFGLTPILEVLPDELRILQPEHWLLYAQMAFVWLLVGEYPVFSLHAAVSAIQDLAVVLVGSSGSGKSTLSWALHQEGANYYGDESAFFAADTHQLYPWPRQLCLRPGGVEALGSPLEAPIWYESKPNDSKCAVSLPAAPSLCPPDNAALFFMDGFAEKPGLLPLSGSDAVRRVLKSIDCGPMPLAERLHVAAGLVSRYPCWKLAVGSPAETASLLARYAGDRSLQGTHRE